MAGAFVLLAVAGISRSVFDVTGRILLQRAAPPHVLGQVFALLESLMGVDHLRAIFVPALVGFGAPAALRRPALLLLVIVAVVWRRLRSIDGAADVPQVQIQLLRLLPIFAPLPAPELEGLARALEPVHVAAGTTVIREGKAGDRFYAIASGGAAGHQERPRREAAAPGRRLRRDRPDRGRAAPATVTARTDAELFSLAEPFILALTGHAPRGTRGQRHGLQAPQRARRAVASSEAPAQEAVSWKRRNPDAYRALVLRTKEDVASGVRPSMDAYGHLLRRPHMAAKLGLTRAPVSRCSSTLLAAPAAE